MRKIFKKIGKAILSCEVAACAVLAVLSLSIAITASIVL